MGCTLCCVRRWHQVAAGGVLQWHQTAEFWQSCRAICKDSASREWSMKRHEVLWLRLRLWPTRLLLLKQLCSSSLGVNIPRNCAELCFEIRDFWSKLETSKSFASFIVKPSALHRSGHTSTLQSPTHHRAAYSFHMARATCLNQGRIWIEWTWTNNLDEFCRLCVCAYAAQGEGLYLDVNWLVFLLCIAKSKVSNVTFTDLDLDQTRRSWQIWWSTMSSVTL